MAEKQQGAALTRAAPDRPALDVTALRRALHGWWMGNPLVYMPALESAAACASELERTGGAPGTTIVAEQRVEQGEMVRRIALSLILPPDLPVAALGEEAAIAAEEVMVIARERGERDPNAKEWQHDTGAIIRTWVAPATRHRLLCATLEVPMHSDSSCEREAAASGGRQLLSGPEALLATLLHRLDLRYGAL